MKRFVPILIAGIVFVIALMMMQPEPLVSLVAAAADLPAGHIVQASDLKTVEMPKSMAPAGAFNDPSVIVGQRLRLARTAGDLLFPSHMGGETIVLQPDERAIAIHVTDSGGLAGLLKPGDQVGITAVLPDGSGSGTFGKAVVGGLRVLYISPSFQAEDPPAEPSSTSPQSTEESSSSGAFSTSGSGLQGSTQRQETGTVVLAVPITARVVGYDFTAFGVPNDTRLIYAVDLLPALDQAGNAKLSLYLEPEQAQAFVSSGIYLPDLVRTPGPSPTPTETPFGPTAVTGTPSAGMSVPATGIPPLPTVTPTPKPKRKG